MRYKTIFCILCCLVVQAKLYAASGSNYQTFRQHMPKSILVIPPMNNTVEPMAPYSCLATISRPLAEAGYYVYPVAVVDAFLKENGLPTPGEMNAIPLDKIDEIIGADAVLYMTVTDYGQKYMVISSDTVFRANAKLVDVKTGKTLWYGSAKASQSSSDNQNNNGLAAHLLSALVSQVVASSADSARKLATTANRKMINHKRSGLLKGPRHRSFAADKRGR